MHVPGSPVPRPARLPFAAAVVAMFASVVGIANAVEFDEKVKSPQMKSASDLLARSQAYFAREAEQRPLGLGALVRNRQLAQEQFDIAWQLERAIDDKLPLGDFSAQGVIDRGDGTYSVDLSAYPQWVCPADHLATMLVALDPAKEGVARELTRRGMSAADLGKLTEYLSSHPEGAATRSVALPIAVSFSRVVKKFDKLKRPVPDSLVRAYLYQRERATTEARRLWAVAMLDAIGPSATRILDSFFGEAKESGIWGPSDTRAGTDDLLADMRLPDFEQRAAAQAKGATP